MFDVSKKILCLAIGLLPVHLLPAQEFEDHFSDSVLQVDYALWGHDSTLASLIKLKKYPGWNRKKTGLTAGPDLGDFQLLVESLPLGQPIYRYQYSLLYREWQTTGEPTRRNRYFNESVIMPLPKHKALVKIQSRDTCMNFQSILEFTYNPDRVDLKEVQNNRFPARKIFDSGSPEDHVDFVFIPEGYTIDEMEKFRKDVDRFSGYLFNWKPFTKYREAFNLWLIEAPSAESGSDIPGENSWKNTLLNSRFYTFNSERYLSVQNIPLLKDIATLTPHDHVIILVNSGKYGGGGIYNQYSITSVDHPHSETVFLHELGHGFAGLADEYSSDVAYSNYYSLDQEPLQFNITSLVNFECKWQYMIKDSTPVPTPDTDEYDNTIGAFEGAGYSREGLYRPYRNCSMRVNLQDGFCPVCHKAITEMIRYYTGELENLRGTGH